MRDEPIDCIFASPFLRTIQTASHIADALNLPVYLEPGIGEILPNVQAMPELLPEEDRALRFLPASTRITARSADSPIPRVRSKATNGPRPQPMR